MPTALHWYSLGLFAALLIVLEALHQHFLMKAPVPFSEPLNVMSVEEFRKESELKKLVILDDLVLDVSEFVNAHPGGRFLLERNSGRDISKFFYGGYSLES